MDHVVFAVEKLVKQSQAVNNFQKFILYKPISVELLANVVDC